MTKLPRYTTDPGADTSAADYINDQAMPDKNSELREQVLTEFKQVHKLAPADYTENCTNVVMSIIQAHTNAEIAKVLDRLGDQSVTVLPETYPTGSRTSIDAVPLEAIQAERALIEKRMT